MDRLEEKEEVYRKRAETDLIEIIKPLGGVRRLLDIGCGHAFVTIELSKWLQLDMIYLMDGAEGPRRNGYSEEPTAPWFDVEIARRHAEEAHVPFAIVKPDPAATHDVDGIISLLSWGFHYPVSTYLELAKRSLRSGGSLILDLRNGRCGFEEIVKNGFIHRGLLSENRKAARHLFRRTE